MQENSSNDSNRVNKDQRIESVASETDDETVGLPSKVVRELMTHVKGDRNRYIQILLNFLSNAIKFSSAGKHVRIVVTLLELQEQQEMANLNIDNARNSSQQFNSNVLLRNTNENVPQRLNSEMPNMSDSKKGVGDEDVNHIDCSARFSIEIKD